MGRHRGSRGRHRLARPATGGMLVVGAALVAASTASSSVPAPLAATPVPPPSSPSPVADSRGAGGNTAPTASWPARVETVGRIVHDVPEPYGTSGIPATVLAAYRRAAERTGLVQPGCRLPLELLAAIGKVESGHARGGRVAADGTTLEPILGPVLDGAGPFAAIGDTDGGTLDGDAVWDRAVGPMQFIPGTWSRWQADGNVDGRPDPHNVYDASLAAARYLCAANRDLGTPDGLDAAILSYNRSGSYLSLVRSWMVVYQDGAISVADITGAVNPAAQAAVALPAGGLPAGSPSGSPAGSPSGGPPAAPPPAAPPTTPSPPPQPQPPLPPPPTTPPPTTPPTPATPPSEPPVQPPVTEPVPPSAEGSGLVCGVVGLIGGLLGLGKPC